MATLPPSPFTWRQVRSAGISRRRFRDMLSEGGVRRVLRGVYAEAAADDNLELRSRAAALVVHPDSVVCDRTAAWVHGVDVLAYAELEHRPPIETCTLRGVRASRLEGCVGKERDLRSEDIVEIAGLRVTTPLRTALDLGCGLSRSGALAALDRFMRDHGITRDELQEQLPRYFRRRGVVQLRQLVGLASPLAESPGESWTRMAILDAGLPTPELQWWIEIDGVPTFRLDLAYPALRIVIEYDGREFHSEDEAKEHDGARRDWLERHGWIVIVVDREKFTRDELEIWTRALRTAIRKRSEEARRLTLWHKSAAAPGQRFVS